MLKRLVDIIFSLCILILLSPVIAVAALQIHLKLGSPILFRQCRPGLRSRPFQLIKFRTMCDRRNANGRLLSDDERLTPFGHWLRSTSLDELPELWNVLKGDMSLVGPRPLLMEYLPLYNNEQRRRHEVLPGVTGWAQVNGRNALSWEERFKLDVWYVDNRSFWLDMKILWMTVKKVLAREGINAEGQATCEKFRGNQPLKRLAIMGASGHGRVVADMAELLGWVQVTFFDDAWPERRDNGAWPIVGPTESLLREVGAFDGVVVAIGDNRIRLQKQQQLALKGAKLVSLIHPQASVSRYASIGLGAVVMAGAVINADANLGPGCIVNTGATVDHDCELGDGVHLSPGAHLAGAVKVGRESWIGIGACVRQLVKIGDGVVVGAGAAVIHNLPDHCTAIGVPAKIIRLD